MLRAAKTEDEDDGERGVDNTTGARETETRALVKKPRAFDPLTINPSPSRTLRFRWRWRILRRGNTSQTWKMTDMFLSLSALDSRATEG